MLHFVGRDATDEMDAYHSKKDLRRVGGFVVGRVDGREVSSLVWQDEAGLSTPSTRGRSTDLLFIIPPHSSLSLHLLTLLS